MKSRIVKSIDQAALVCFLSLVGVFFTPTWGVRAQQREMQEAQYDLYN